MTAAAAVVIFFNTGLPPWEPETLTGTANRVTVVTWATRVNAHNRLVNPFETSTSHP
jgi:hypothetical protein